MEKINLGEELKALVEALSGLSARLSAPANSGSADLLHVLDEALERDGAVMDLLFQLEEKLNAPFEARPLLEALKTHFDRSQQDHQRLFDGLHTL